MKRAVWGVMAAVGATVACAMPIVSAPRAVAATGSTARTTLISAGKAPRSTLRLSLTQGTAIESTLVMTESIDQSLDGKPTNSVQTPPINFGMRTTVDAVSAKTADLVTTYHDVTVVDDGSYTAAQRSQVETNLAPLTSVKVTATVTSRNESVDSEVSGTEGLSATTAQLMEQLSDQRGGLSVPFPLQAVGVGARWRSTSTATVSGIDIRQEFQFTLVERDGNDVTLSMKSLQTAPRQRANLPGVPAGTKVFITKYQVVGSGTMTLDLAEPIAVVAESHAAGSQVFSISAQGQSGTLTQKVAIDVALSRPS